MRVLLQRVSEASVTVAGDRIAAIGPGLLALVGVQQGDTEAAADWLAAKTVALRVFADAGGAMNLSVLETGGAVLVVSQFTLAADVARGRRPGFSGAAAPQQALALYERYLTRVRAGGATVASGRFGADMQVALVNDGPATFLLER